MKNTLLFLLTFFVFDVSFVNAASKYEEKKTNETSKNEEFITLKNNTKSHRIYIDNLDDLEVSIIYPDESIYLMANKSYHLRYSSQNKTNSKNTYFISKFTMYTDSSPHSLKNSSLILNEKDGYPILHLESGPPGGLALLSIPII